MTPPAPSQPPRRPVWLFKAPPTTSGESYTSELQAAGFEPRYIPTLVEEFDTAELEKCLADGETWDGVIITSKRGAEGWVRAVKALQTHKPRTLRFSSLPLYTVGTTSIDTLAAAEISHHLLPDLMDATSAKSALALGDQMLRDLPPAKEEARRFLFVRGDKSANDLQPMLRDAGYTVQEVQVYTTAANPELARLVAEEIGGLASLEGKGEVWLVFFSPSSAGYALPHLDQMLGGKDAAVPRARIAAIGEKSRAFLGANGLTVDAVADEPNAVGLVQALRGAI